MLTDGLDKVSGGLQPESSKSTSQKLGDYIQSGHDNAKVEVDGANQKPLKETAADYAEMAKQKLGEAAEYVSATLAGAKEGAEKGVK